MFDGSSNRCKPVISIACVALTLVVLEGTRDPLFAQPSESTHSATPADAQRRSVSIGESSLGYVNVRQKPDINSRVIGKVQPGERYGSSRTRDGWVWLDEKHGWIAHRYVLVSRRSRDEPGTARASTAKRDPNLGPTTAALTTTRGGPSAQRPSAAASRARSSDRPAAVPSPGPQPRSPAAAVSPARAEPPTPQVTVPDSVPSKEQRPSLQVTLDWLAQNLPALSMTATATDSLDAHQVTQRVTPIAMDGCNIRLSKETRSVAISRESPRSEERMTVTLEMRIPLGRVSRVEIGDADTRDEFGGHSITSGGGRISPTTVKRITIYTKDNSIQEQSTFVSYSSITGNTGTRERTASTAGFHAIAASGDFLERIKAAVLSAAERCRSQEPF